MRSARGWKSQSIIRPFADTQSAEIERGITPASIKFGFLRKGDLVPAVLPIATLSGLKTMAVTWVAHLFHCNSYKRCLG
ncbi:hypothetical protein J6590_068230 [Homalodisca vitripennis]|nr:hypothetical protein J6590_068230 [Homalodisca vitripennis]